MVEKRFEIAKRLKKARVLSGLSQEQCATILGVQRPTISEIEAGRRKVSAEEIIQLSHIYEVKPSWILDTEHSNSKPKSEQYILAARELEKLNPKEIEKVLELMKIVSS